MHTSPRPRRTKAGVGVIQQLGLYRLAEVWWIVVLCEVLRTSYRLIQVSLVLESLNFLSLRLSQATGKQAKGGCISVLSVHSCEWHNEVFGLRYQGMWGPTLDLLASRPKGLLARHLDEDQENWSEQASS